MRLLAARGEEVVGVDSGAPPAAAGLTGPGVEISLDDDGLGHIARIRCVVKSPGVPGQAPAIAAARERGIPVLGELELAWRLLPNRFVAVTGTNGKTTVAELLGEIWRAAGEPVVVAGNVGTPLASLVGEVSPHAAVVCEASSFQLEDTLDFAPECAALLNVSPDHIDRHGDLDAYLDAKLRIFANQGPGDVAVLNGCEPALEGRELEGAARRVAFCGSCEAAGCEIHSAAGTIIAGGEPLIGLDELAIPGAHNAENAMAAAGCALAMGLGRKAVVAGLRAFAGVPHRLERVAEVGGVGYVNDSKATNVAAARAAVLAFSEPVHVILGGSSKGESFGALAEPLTGHARAAYLIGATAADLERDLEAAWEAGVEHDRYPDLEAAFAAASAAAEPGEVVLLAPACASFDAHRDYEERGERFRSLAEALS